MPRPQFSLKTMLWVMVTAIAISMVLRGGRRDEYETAALGWLCAILIVVAATAK